MNSGCHQLRLMITVLYLSSSPARRNRAQSINVGTIGHYITFVTRVVLFLKKDVLFMRRVILFMKRVILFMTRIVIFTKRVVLEG